MLSATDILERDAYEHDPSLFWLWPERWLETPINKASQKFEAFWRFIPRARDWIRVKVGSGSIGADLWGETAPRFEGLIDRRHAAPKKMTGFGGWGLLYPKAPCSKKTTFASLASALEEFPLGGPFRSYRCSACNLFHITVRSDGC